MLLFHIITAIFSLIASSLAAYHPSKTRFTLTYVATVGTLLSGVMLTVMESVTLVRVCISGGVYLVGVISLILIARRKMAAALLY